MSEPSSSPSNLLDDAALSPHELASNALVSTVQFYVAALGAERVRQDRLRLQLQQVSGLQRQYIDDNDRLRKELAAAKANASANLSCLMRLSPLLKALADEFEPKQLKPRAYDDTILGAIYDAWLVLRINGELVAKLVRECGDPARATAAGSGDGHA